LMEGNTMTMILTKGKQAPVAPAGRPPDAAEAGPDEAPPNAPPAS